jgi:hypothetical protein
MDKSLKRLATVLILDKLGLVGKVLGTQRQIDSRVWLSFLFDSIS